MLFRVLGEDMKDMTFITKVSALTTHLIIEYCVHSQPVYWAGAASPADQVTAAFAECILVL